MKIYNLRMLTLLALLACLVPAMALNLDFNPSTKHSQWLGKNHHDRQ